jgi:hypothetical protein
MRDGKRYVVACRCCMTQVEMTTESILVYLKVIRGREDESHVALQVHRHSPLLLQRSELEIQRRIIGY